MRKKGLVEIRNAPRLTNSALPRMFIQTPSVSPSIPTHIYRERENVHYENALHIQILIWRNTLIV
jgi:hypothetical protein